MKRFAAVSAAVIMSLSILSACGSQETAETQDTQAQTTEAETTQQGEAGEGEQAAPDRQNRGAGKAAQVTAINADEDTITLKLAAEPQGEMPQGEAPQGEMPQGEAPQGEAPQGNEPQGEAPQGEEPQENAPQGEAPQGNEPQGNEPNGEAPQGKMQEMTFDGDELVVTNASEILKTFAKAEEPEEDSEKGQPNGGFDESSLEALDISEISEGDILNVIYDENNETVKYIVKTPQREGKGEKPNA